MKRTFAGVKSETQRASQEELDYLELGWSLTCDLIGISDQIKVLLTLLLLCVLSFLVFERTFTRARCVYYSVDNLPWLLQMCSVVQLYWKRSCWKKKGSGGCLYLWKTDTHCVCFMPFCPPPPNGTGVAARRSECAAVGPLPLCALWLKGAGSPWLNPAVVKALGGGPSRQFALLNNL